MIHRLGRAWRGLRQGSTNRRILAASILLTSGTVVVKLVAMIREILIARSFGTGDQVDAFLMAYTIISFLVLIVGGSLHVSLLPHYVAAREQQGQADAQRVLSGVLPYVLGLLLLLSGLLLVFDVPVLGLLAHGFSPGKVALTRGLLRELLPLLYFGSLTFALSAVVNAHERFQVTSLAPALSALTSLLALLLGLRWWGIHTLTYALSAGSLLEVTTLCVALNRLGLSVRPRREDFRTYVLPVVRQFAPMAAGQVLLGANLLVDNAMAAPLGSGLISTLGYGNKIPALMLSLSEGLIAAVLPYFSQMVASRDWDGIRHTLRTYTRLILMVTVPVTLAVILLSPLLVALLYQRGAFTAADTARVSLVQRMYLLQVPIAVVMVMVMRLVSSLRGNSWLMWGAAIKLSCNVGFNYLFLMFWGAAGIALSTSVTAAVAALTMFFALSRLLPRPDEAAVPAA